MNPHPYLSLRREEGGGRREEGGGRRRRRRRRREGRKGHECGGGDNNPSALTMFTSFLSPYSLSLLESFSSSSLSTSLR